MLKRVPANVLQNILVLTILLIFWGYEASIVLKTRQSLGAVTQVDDVVYLSSVVYLDQPENFERDLIYNHNDAQLPKNYWLTAAAYMFGLDAAHQLAEEDIERTFSYYRLLILALYLPAMYVFLRYLLPWLPALLMTLISSYPASSFLLTGRAFWGLPPRDFTQTGIQYLMPDRLAMVFIPLGILYALHYWLLPGKKSNPIHVLGLGVFTGSAIYLLHTTTALPVIQLLIAVAFIQAVRGKLPWWSVLLYTLVAVFFILLRTFIGSGVQENVTLTPAMRQNLEVTFVFPWRMHWNSFSFIDQPGLLPVHELKNMILGFFALYLLLSIVGLGIIWQRRSQIGWVIFLFAQMLLCLVFLRAGWLPGLAFIYGCYRLAYHRADELDWLLLLMLVVGVLLGPFQQIFLYYLWQFTGAASLSGPLAEMSRFLWISFLPFYTLIGRAIWELTAFIPVRWLRYSMITALAYLIWRNLNVYGLSPEITMGQAGVIICGAILALHALWTQNLGWMRQLPQAAAVIAMPLVAGIVLKQPLIPVILLFFAGIVWLSSRRYALSAALTLCLYLPLLVPMDQPIRTQLTIRPITPDYLAMTEWIKTNTPRDALFHSTTLEANFRLFAKRSLLLGSWDDTQGIYGGLDNQTLAALKNQLYDPATRMEALIAYEVDYIAAVGGDYPNPTLYEERLYLPLIVYENPAYKVYKLESVPSHTPRTTQEKALLENWQAQTLTRSAAPFPAFLPPAYTPDAPVIVSATQQWQSIYLIDQVLPDDAAVLQVYDPAGQQPIDQFFPLSSNALDITSPDVKTTLQDFIGQREEVWLLTVEISPTIEPIISRTLREMGYELAVVPLDDARLRNQGFALYHFLKVPEKAEVAQFGAEPITLSEWAVINAVPLVPCETVRLRSWWYSPVTPVQNYTLSIGVINAAGERFAQRDAYIGNFPAQLWLPDTLYFDERDLTIPCDLAAGTYQIIAFLYAEQNGALIELPLVGDTATRFTLTTFTVE